VGDVPILNKMDTDHEALESIRRRLDHEDNLVNQRLSWILTSQAFLLTGYAILLNAPIDLRSPMHVRHHGLLMWLIPLTGIVTVLLIWLAILGALIALRDLRACAAHVPRRILALTQFTFKDAPSLAGWDCLPRSSSPQYFFQPGL